MRQPSDEISPEVLRQNLERVRRRMAAAAARTGRNPDSVRLVAVTKYTGAAQIRSLLDLGVRDIGESRVQDAEKKHAALGAAAGRACWHLIGHLQTNKANKAVKIFQKIHSVDSFRMAEALDKEARKHSVLIEGLLEVNVAGETNKSGLKPDATELTALLKALAPFSSLRIAGLMAMAPFAEKPEPVARPVFRHLRELRDELNRAAAYPRPLAELSMGMTQDFEIAIEEGSTVVRIGSALMEE